MRQIYTETTGVTKFLSGFYKASKLGRMIQKTPLGQLSRVMDDNIVGKDVWQYDKKSEAKLPLKHVKYDEKNKVLYTESWNYSLESLPHVLL